MSDSLKKKTISGLFWSFAENFFTQALGFVIGVILARLLSPADYGLVGMVGILGAVASAIINSGFSVALIRNQERTERDFSTTFYFNVVVGAFLYVIVYLLAPYVASFYKIPELIDIIRVISITFLLGSLTVVQQAKFIISMDFKSLAIVAVVTTLVSGAISIYMAYEGYGVWALVWSYVITGIVRVVLVWILCGWIPKESFSRQSFNWLFGFGSKILASSLIDTFYNNLMPIFLGKFYAPSDLGYYSRAQGYANLPSVVITSQIQKVTFPVLSEIQHDSDRLASVYRRLILSTSFVVFPLMLLLAAEARPLILFLIGEKWIPSIILLQILCLVYMLYPVHALNLNLLEVIGRSDLFLKLEVYKKVIGVVFLIMTLPFGINAMCLGQLLLSLVSLGINTYYTQKLLGVSLLTQIKDLQSTLLLALSMAVIVYLLDASVVWNDLRVEIVVLSIFAVVYYLGLAWFLKIDGLQDLLTIIRIRK